MNAFLFSQQFFSGEQRGGQGEAILIKKQGNLGPGPNRGESGLLVSSKNENNPKFQLGKIQI